LAAQGRHPYRPEHVHFMISAPGQQTLVTHLFIDNDPYLDSDVVFGVKNSLITDYSRHDAGTAPDGSTCHRDFLTLNYDFVLNPEAG
jgi:hydroxyquinol 1,2-dioxygenase